MKIRIATALTGPIVCFDPSFAKQKGAATPQYQLFPVLISPTKLNIQHSDYLFDLCTSLK